MKIEIDTDQLRIRVGDFLYSLTLLSDGFQTRPGEAVVITKGEPSADGSRPLIFRVVSTLPTSDEELTRLAERFCRARLPDTVCADLCATMQGYPHRSGTNLLSVAEAQQVLRDVLLGDAG